MALRVGLVGLFIQRGFAGYVGLRGLYGLRGLAVVRLLGGGEDGVLRHLSAMRGTTNSELEIGRASCRERV